MKQIIQVPQSLIEDILAGKIGWYKATFCDTCHEYRSILTGPGVNAPAQV